jgi:hypothetical protein
MVTQNMALPDGVEILLPWRDLCDLPDQAQRLSAELSSELSSRHVLFGLKATAIASRVDRDDVLFEIANGSAPFAMVHLSWRKEADPRWPSTKLFTNWDEWVRAEMFPAHEDYVAASPPTEGPPPTEEQLRAATFLESVIHSRNPKQAESAVIQASSALHPIHAPALIQLAEAPWHQRHEDVVHALQQLRSPEAVSTLERVTFSNHAYLAYDNNHALARKCTWALADIGTQEAQQALKRIAGCTDPTIAGYAKKRLDNWQKESHRKG